MEVTFIITEANLIQRLVGVDHYDEESCTIVIFISPVKRDTVL